MSSITETRLGNALRERLSNGMGDYISALDSIDVTKRGALARFSAERERYEAFEEVVGWIDEIEEELSK